MALASGETRAGASGVLNTDGRSAVVNINGITDTVAAGNNTTAPAGGAVLATTTANAPAAGVYDVEVNIVLTATAETALRNVDFRVNGSTLARLMTLTGIPMKFKFPRVTLPSGYTTAFDIVAVANATAGSIYNTQITATRVQ